EEAEGETKKDEFTKKLIEESSLPKHRQKALYKMAAVLHTSVEDGVESDEYKSQFRIVVDAMRQGDILQSLRELARQPLPDFGRVIEEVSELTARELADFTNYISGRLEGIEALRKIIEAQSFKKGKNERELHDLLESNPWLIDPTFTQFLTSNV